MTVLLLVLCATALISYIATIFIGLSFFAKAPLVDSSFQPPVSILKPVCGLDQGAYENWASFCQQSYPSYQIIFGVRDSKDPAIAVVRRLIQDFPNVDIRLVVEAHTIGNNLKVSNLANLEPYAEYNLILISDSDIRVGQDYLQQIVQPMGKLRTGVVTCLYRSCVYSFVAALEALSISTDFHGTVLLARQLGWMKFAMGSSILIRRKVLDAIGGFSAIADHLADDFMLGNLTVQAGFTVELSSYVVNHTLETKNLLDLVQHQTRWNRCTRAANPLGYFGLIFGQGTTFSLALLAFSGGSTLGWTVLALTWTARLLMGWVVGVKELQDRVAARWFWLVPLRDLLSFGLWAYGLIGDRVVWRGKQFRLVSGGKLVSLHEPLPAVMVESCSQR